MDSGNSGENDASMQIAYSGRMTQWIYISFFLHYFLLLLLTPPPLCCHYPPLPYQPFLFSTTPSVTYKDQDQDHFNTTTHTHPAAISVFFCLLHFGILKGMIKKLTLYELSKIFVEHTLHVARIQFQTQALQPCTRHKGVSYDHCFINKQMPSLQKTSLMGENKIDQSRGSGCIDFKGVL